MIGRSWPVMHTPCRRLELATEEPDCCVPRWHNIRNAIVKDRHAVECIHEEFWRVPHRTTELVNGIGELLGDSHTHYRTVATIARRRASEVIGEVDTGRWRTRAGVPDRRLQRELAANEILRAV